MIKNIPEAQDFYISGKELFNFAWDTVAELLINFDLAGDYGLDEDEISDSYWGAAVRRLTTALSITQQGVEFMLKGKITEISPFLLITDSPKKWPSPYTNASNDFSQYRTIDAQDLIKVHDSVSANQLNANFTSLYHALRQKRNAIMHSVDKKISVHVKEVIESILFMHKTLFPQENWAHERLKFLESSPDAKLGNIEWSTNRVCWELSLAMTILTPSQVKNFFSINKTQKKYFCPVCWDNASHDADFDYQLAILFPKGANSNQLYCPICNKQHTVIRGKCEGECKNAVLSDKGMCLICLNEQIN